jgi:tellurite resistance protein TerC
MLGLDLGVLQKRAHTPSPREALGFSIVWVALACLFGGWIAHQAGAEVASEYFTAYVVEKSLSVDNLFVFILVFGALKIPDALQHRVLFWGILGAIVLRGAMIFAGSALLHQFHWLVYGFGALLIFGGLKILREWRRQDDAPPEEGRLFTWVKRYLPMSKELDGQRFVTRVDGRRVFTPLLGALLVIELSDVVFALDSIPAVLAISDDAFVVYTSNVFALLGLRSLYFLLARVLHRMQELKVGLAGVLVFVGLKMLLADVVHVSPAASLAVILGLLGVPTLVAIVRSRRPTTEAAHRSADEMR